MNITFRDGVIRLKVEVKGRVKSEEWLATKYFMAPLTSEVSALLQLCEHQVLPHLDIIHTSFLNIMRHSLCNLCKR